MWLTCKIEEVWLATGRIGYVLLVRWSLLGSCSCISLLQYVFVVMGMGFVTGCVVVSRLRLQQTQETIASSANTEYRWYMTPRSTLICRTFYFMPVKHINNKRVFHFALNQGNRKLYLSIILIKQQFFCTSVICVITVFLNWLIKDQVMNEYANI